MEENWKDEMLWWRAGIWGINFQERTVLCESSEHVSSKMKVKEGGGASMLPQNPKGGRNLRGGLVQLPTKC